MDLYILLGLAREATVGDIKRAYKRLARRYHPDINPGDGMAAAQFRQIAEAYETLSDPDRRRQYDQTGQMSRIEEQTTYGFEGFDFSISASESAAPTFGDLFAEVLRHRDPLQPDGAAERGADLHQALGIAFEEAMQGGQRNLTVTRQERCRTCGGGGWLHVSETPCAHCQGAGMIRSTRRHMVFSRPCAHCGGSGQQRRSRCPRCEGQQTEMRTETLSINVPAGLSDGARVRIPGMGHAGRHGGEAGDLYITVQVQPHPLFRREGDDLHLTIPIAVHEAALGARIDVPSFDGPVKLRVPPGTQSGQRFRVRERGVPSPRDGRRGDLVIEARLVLPRVLDERSKELLREFGRVNLEDVRKDLGRDEENR